MYSTKTTAAKLWTKYTKKTNSQNHIKVILILTDLKGPTRWVSEYVLEFEKLYNRTKCKYPLYIKCMYPLWWHRIAGARVHDGRFVHGYQDVWAESINLFYLLYCLFHVDVDRGSCSGQSPHNNRMYPCLYVTCRGTGMIASSSTFRPHPGRVIRDLLHLLYAVYGIVWKH